MNKISSRVKVNVKGPSCVTGIDVMSPHALTLITKPRTSYTPPPIKPYIDAWWLRAGISLGKTPTEEEHKLEKMVFQYLWDLRVMTERGQLES